MTNNAKPNRRGLNLSQADRERGGKTSAAKQRRDARGQFAGSKNTGGHTTHSAHTTNPKKNVQNHNGARNQHGERSNQLQDVDQDEQEDLERGVSPQERTHAAQRAEDRHRGGFNPGPETPRR